MHEAEQFNGDVPQCRSHRKVDERRTFQERQSESCALHEHITAERLQASPTQVFRMRRNEARVLCHIFEHFRERGGRETAKDCDRAAEGGRRGEEYRSVVNCRV